MKRFLIILATTAALSQLHAQPAECVACAAAACFSPGSCLPGCICIQPDGPGTQGFCNSAGLAE